MTRPDISSVVCTVAKFYENQGMKHWKAGVKILQQYVWKTPERGVTYGGSGNDRAVMRAFVDSDHATSLGTIRSHLREAVLLAGGTISWFLRPQATTAEETSEAEYMVMLEIVKEVQFFRQVQAFIICVLKHNLVEKKRPCRRSWRINKGSSRWLTTGIQASQKRKIAQHSMIL